MDPQDVPHLFDCVAHPNDLSPVNLWDKPIETIRELSFRDPGNLNWSAAAAAAPRTDFFSDAYADVPRVVGTPEPISSSTSSSSRLRSGILKQKSVPT